MVRTWARCKQWKDVKRDPHTWYWNLAHEADWERHDAIQLGLQEMGCKFVLARFGAKPLCFPPLGILMQYNHKPKAKGICCAGVW